VTRRAVLALHLVSRTRSTIARYNGARPCCPTSCSC